MTADAGPFDPGADDRDTHLVLENAEGRRSLWPFWREPPAGWTVRFGPAPYARCVERLESARPEAVRG
ncbi:MbtH family NRPS accessory protein [Streptomyces sp. NPDC001595]|uniref:MbtH family NRPS accessory protein n=1 Tax=Streptomyces sp. NPDC001532 TaxID=3154520 RepID=UPI0033311C0A